MKRAAACAVPLAAISAAGFDQPADAADLFLHLDNVTGESIIQGHEGDMDVFAWSWGLENAGGPPSFSEIKIIKSFDLASPTLLLAAAQGTNLGSGVISINRPDGQGGLFEYLKISLDNVLISKVAQGGKQAEGAITETITLNYSKIFLEYATGTKTGGTKACWDVQQNQQC